MDLLAHHAEEPFHALIGGGDQLYCDSIVREPEMQDWVNQTKAENKKNYRLTDEMAIAIDRFFFNHYCQSFRSGAFARANSTMCVSPCHAAYTMWEASEPVLTRPLQTDAQHAWCAHFLLAAFFTVPEQTCPADDHGERLGEYDVPRML